MMNIPDLINEKNTPILLNSMAGFFFPCVHTCFSYDQDKRIGTISLQTVQQIIQWQKKVIMYQVFIFNLGVLIVLLTIFLLVTFVDAFYYKNNILDFFWFCMAVIYLISTAIFSMVWSLRIYPDKMFRIEERENDKTAASEDVVSRKKSRHLTGESNTESTCSATTSFIRDSEGPRLMKTRAVFCLSMSVVVLIPAILGITFYKILPENSIYVIKFKTNHENIEANIVGVTENFGVTRDLGFIKPGRIIITNKTDDHFDASNIDVVLLIDTRPAHEWRVSSPRRKIFPGLSTPVLVVRQVDLSLQKLTLSGNLLVTSNISHLSHLLAAVSPCSQDSVVYINYQEEREERKKSGLKEKYFSRQDGRILQDWDLIVSCTAEGFNCQLDSPQRINVDCKDFNKSIETKYVNWPNKRVLSKLTIFNINGKENNFCCFNSSHAIEMFGYGDPVSTEIVKNNCSYSNLIEETHKFDIEFYEFCQVGDIIIKKSFQRDFDNNILTSSCNVKEYPC